MSEHNEIDELLIDHKLLKKAKRKTWIRNIIISTVSFFVLYIATIYTNAQLLNKIASKTVSEEELLFEVARPNTYFTHSQFNDGFLRGELEYSTYKLLGQKPVFSGTYKKVYSILPISHGISGTSDSQLLKIRDEPGTETWQYFNKIGQKAMMFYHPLLTYREIAADLTTLEQYRDDALFEVTLSFDQGYHFNEINRLMPNKVIPSWYWVDTFGENATEQYIPIYNDKDEKTGEFAPFVINPNHIIGFSSIDRHGDKILSPQEGFLIRIQIGLNQKGRYLSTYETAYNTLKDENGNMTPDNISIIGVVVTGDKKAMETLLDLPFVRASSFGVILD